jgi:hypothetical protein
MSGCRSPARRFPNDWLGDQRRAHINRLNELAQGGSEVRISPELFRVTGQAIFGVRWP